jgi:hypothetical protein
MNVYADCLQADWGSSLLRGNIVDGFHEEHHQITFAFFGLETSVGNSYSYSFPDSILPQS